MKKILLFLLAFIIAGSLVYSQVPASPILIEPPKQTNVTSLTPTLSWNSVVNADCYFIFITTDTNVSATMETCMSNTPDYQVPANQLTTGVTYYWYVKAHNNEGWSECSPYFSFTVITTTIGGSISDIKDDVTAISEAGRLSANQANILNNRLEQANHQITLGHNFTALVHMGLFKLRVFVLRISGMMTPGDAALLNEGADGVIDLIQDLNRFTHAPVEVPKEFSLKQNYPNPFNPSTTIEYSVPENSVVTLKVYDILGKEVASLVNKYQEQGSYIVNWDASGFSSGVYIYKISAGSLTDTKKMVLSK